MRRWIALACTICIATTTLVAADLRKPPWQYTDEERLATRFDPASVKARAKREARPEVSSNGVAAQDGTWNHVSGREHPELLMPHELFRSLLLSSLVDRGNAVYRERTSEKIRSYVDAENFWTQLQAASRPYTALLEQEEVLRARLNAADPAQRAEILRQMEAVQAPQCAARASALQSAARAIGRERLYRALYEVVAPTMSIAMSPDYTAEQDRLIARGCQ